MFSYKKIALTVSVWGAWALGAVSVAHAQELGRVISSQAVVQQVAVPRQICSQQQVIVPGQKSGAGGLMGAIAGGAIGNNVGGGTGRGVATVLGVIGGAMLGDRIEGAPPAQAQTVQNCTTQQTYENQTIGYNVVYEYNGKQYHVQMPNDPGPYVQLQVTPIGAASVPPVMPAAPANVYPAPAVQPVPVVQPAIIKPVVMAAPVVTQVVYAQPAVIYPRAYYTPSISIGVGFGWHAAHGHHRRYW